MIQKMNKYEYFQYAHFCFVIALFMFGISFHCSIAKNVSFGMMLGISTAYFFRGIFTK